jgi:hypothetical protein
MAKAKAIAQRTELMKKRKVDDESKMESWTLSKNRGKMNAWRDNISHKREISQEFNADINFPEINWMSYSVELIRRYRALQ